MCVSPSRLPLKIQDGIAVCTVVGFPSGTHESEIKAAEAALAIRRGATEIDMVVDLGKVLVGEWDAVEADVAAVKRACGDVLLKVILETAALSPDQIVEACRRSEAGGAQYVKTSTGFHPAGGASVEAVRLMRERQKNPHRRPLKVVVPGYLIVRESSVGPTPPQPLS